MALRLCDCGSPCIYGRRGSDGREYQKCRGGGCKYFRWSDTVTPTSSEEEWVDDGDNGEEEEEEVAEEGASSSSEEAQFTPPTKRRKAGLGPPPPLPPAPQPIEKEVKTPARDE